MKKGTWTCSMCRGGPWEYSWSDEEARAEHRARFGHDLPEDDLAIVCDDCYEAMLVLRGLLVLVGSDA